jgi:hypothetical protein
MWSEKKSSFGTCEFKFASDYVRDRIIDKAVASDVETLLRFVNSDPQQSDLSALRGQILEKMAHEMLRRGGSFDVRHLGPEGGRETIHLPRTDRVLMFKTFADLDENEYDQYLQPVDKNFAGVDAVIKPNKLFQMTVAAHHGISRQAIVELQSRLHLKKMKKKPQSSASSSSSTPLSAAASAGGDQIMGVVRRFSNAFAG